jgi:chromosome segregation ATPase
LESSPPIEGYTFSRDQIRVIATSLGNEILALREQMSGYSREHYQQLQTQCTALDEHCRRLQEILENLQSRHESLVADRREMKEGYKLLKAEHRTLLKALKSREAELVSLKARPKLFNKVFSTQRWKRRWRRWTKAGVPAPPKVG